MNFTVFGAGGFIGSHIVKSLKHNSVDCFTPGRKDSEIYKRDLGHVIWCIGLTSDFRNRIFDTVEAHVCYLLKILKDTNFDSFLYLSSTRIYQYSETTEETAKVACDPFNTSDLYNISKIMGESLCLSLGNPNIRIARLSNVYGKDILSDNFFSSIIKETIRTNNLILRSSLDSEKDYVNIDDVVDLLPKIAISGKKQVYNIASGVNVSHRKIIEELQKIINFRLRVVEDSDIIKFPKISIANIKCEFDFIPSSLLYSLKGLVEMYKKEGVK